MSAAWLRGGLLRAPPEFDGAWGDLATDLALRAGDPARAAFILLEAGLRNLARSAIASSETVPRRAGDLVAKDQPLAAEADEVLSEVLVQAGKTDEAVAVITRVIQRLPRSAGTQRSLAEARLRLPRVHATAGEWTAAAARIDAIDPQGVGEDLREE